MATIKRKSLHSGDLCDTQSTDLRLKHGLSQSFAHRGSVRTQCFCKCRWKKDVMSAKRTCWSGPTPISTGGLAAISPMHASYPCLLMFLVHLATQKICKSWHSHTNTKNLISGRCGASLDSKLLYRYSRKSPRNITNYIF